MNRRELFVGVGAAALSAASPVTLDQTDPAPDPCALWGEKLLHGAPGEARPFEGLEPRFDTDLVRELYI